MDIPIFPLNVVLFPRMVLPLHIFEPRYREMIAYCQEHQKPFGVALISQGQEVGAPAMPHSVGTVARIVRSKQMPDGRLNITTVGAQRFRIEQLHTSRAFLTASVTPLPIINSATKAAQEMMHHLRPKVAAYVALLAKVSKADLALDQLPQDPKTLAYMVAIALQVNNDEKQKLLELPGIPDMLAREHYLLNRELLVLQHMVDTQADVEAMNIGPTGYIFPN